MSREAFGDPPESQEPPQVCPVCGGEWHAEDCEFGKEVARRLKAERDAHKLAHALENVAMMLRKCAHRLRCNGHEDLGADAVGLLRRFDLLGSPLREVEPVKMNDEAPSNAAHWHKMATEAQAEVRRLREAIGEAYGYLWCVNNEPGTPHQYPPERAAYEARKLLRDLLTTQERGRFINAAVAAVRGSPAGCKTPFGCEERGCLGWCDEHRPDGAAVPDSKTPNVEAHRPPPAAGPVQRMVRPQPTGARRCENTN